MKIHDLGASIPSRETISEREGLEDAARQFETLLTREVMRAMRKTVDAGKGEKSSFGGTMFTQMMDEALSESTAGSMGLAEVIVAQLMPHTGGVSLGVHDFLTDGMWVSPVDEVHESFGEAQRFGAHREGKRPESCKEGHCGLDLAEPVGQPVRAAHSGVVRYVGRNSESSGGLMVELEHQPTGGGPVLRTRYLHLSELADLRPGSHIRGGEVLGKVGNTGTSSRGAHLHFEILERNRGSTSWVDPEPYLRMWQAESSQGF